MRSASLQSCDITSQEVHENCLCHIICVVSGGNHITFEKDGSPVESLPSKHSTKGAIVLSPHLLHNVIHRPAVKIFVGENCEWNAILFLISFDRFQTVIPIACIVQKRQCNSIENELRRVLYTCNSFIDRKENQFQSVTVLFVQVFQNVGKNSGIFSARSSHSNKLAWLKHFCCSYRVMHLSFKGPKKAFFTQCIIRLGSLYTKRVVFFSK